MKCCTCLQQVPVRSYAGIEQLMESGTINRTTASTNMNATSSRSHMVITIRFEQVRAGQTEGRMSCKVTKLIFLCNIPYTRISITR